MHKKQDDKQLKHDVNNLSYLMHKYNIKLYNNI